MLFGEIVGADSISARMVLNDVMPNHFHAIIAINRADMESAPTLSVIVQSFKRNTTIKYINAVKEGKYPPFK